MREEIQDDLGMIRKALTMIEDRSFSLMQNLDAHGETVPMEFIHQFTRAHEELGDMVTHLADLAFA
jgi:hypothetical protein